MNDSISVSSSYSSSTNSNSNSLNRSTINNASFLLNNHNHSNLNSTLAHSFLRHSRIDDLDFPTMIPIRRRRAKSQTIFLGYDLNNISEFNKQLIEDLYFVKKQLKEKDEKIAKLNDIRNKLESEIQELSASLFEEAYLMVNTARAEAAQSEKLLKEANGKIDVLQAEVKALKELVLSSTPSTPNKNLYPQLTTNNNNNNNNKTKSSHSRQSSLNQQSFNLIAQSTDVQNSNTSLNKIITTSTPSSSNHNLNNTQISTENKLTHSTTTLFPVTNGKEKSSFFSKSHKRAPSHNDIQSQSKSILDKIFNNNHKNAENLKSSISNYNNHNNNSLTLSKVESNELTTGIAEFDPIYFRELMDWKENPNLKVKGVFLNRVYDEDILPCLNFDNKKLSEELLAAIESNCVCIEELSNIQQNSEPFSQICGLSNIQSICQYKIKLSETSQWIYISKLSRNRVISVCDFFTYLRYIKDGLVKSDIHEIYWNIIDLRKKITLSRLGL